MNGSRFQPNGGNKCTVFSHWRPSLSWRHHRPALIGAVGVVAAGTAVAGTSTTTAAGGSDRELRLGSVWACWAGRCWHRLRSTIHHRLFITHPRPRFIISHPATIRPRFIIRSRDIMPRRPQRIGLTDITEAELILQ
jgi:hypothetical protein